MDSLSISPINAHRLSLYTGWEKLLGHWGFFAFYFFLITIPILIVYVIMTHVLKAHTPF